MKMTFPPRGNGLNVSNITPDSPPPFYHTWELGKGQAGLFDPQACSAGWGQGLFTIAVVYGDRGPSRERSECPKSRQAFLRRLAPNGVR